MTGGNIFKTRMYLMTHPEAAAAVGVNRRAVARGAAWTVPALTVAAAAPAIASSPTPVPPTLTIPIYASSSNLGGTTSQYTFQSVATAGSQTPGSSFCISNTTAKTTLSTAKVTLYVPIGKGVTFTTGSGGSACWSALAYDASSGTQTYNGCTFYAYTTTYTCAIVGASPSTCLPEFVFTSAANAPALCTPYWYKNASVLANGTKITAMSGPNQYS